MAGWDEGLAELEAEFPGWHVWRSNTGRWWATRTGAVLRREDLGIGRVMTVDADDVGSLRKLLLAQSRLDSEVSGLVTPVDNRVRTGVQNSVDNHLERQLN